MSPLVLLMVLGAALLHASWNALVKSVDDRVTTMAVVNAASALIALPLVIALPAPAPESWPFIAASFLIHHFYFAGLLLAYRFGDLSFVYPVARGSSPLMVAGLAWLAAGEALTPGGLIGVGLLSIAILSLALSGRGGLPALAFALFTGLTIALYTLCDGLGVRASGHAVSYAAWLFLLDGPTLLAFAFWRRGRLFVPALGKVWIRGFVGGALSLMGYGVVIWAMSVSPMAHVAAARETGVVFAALLGARLLGEPFGGRRLAAAACVCLGAVLLQAFRA